MSSLKGLGKIAQKKATLMAYAGTHKITFPTTAADNNNPMNKNLVPKCKKSSKPD